MVLADANGVIHFWSDGAGKVFGYAAAEAIGRTLDLIVPAEYRDAHWSGFRRAITSGTASVEGQTVPFPAQHADGRVVETPGRLTLIRRPQGTVVAAIVVFDEGPTTEE